MTATWPSEPIADATRPLVLLPVRIETRYTADRSALCVRVFPDEVHVDRLETALTEAEEEAGRDGDAKPAA